MLSERVEEASDPGVTPDPEVEEPRLVLAPVAVPDGAAGGVSRVAPEPELVPEL
jgi:hypothetical protein